MKICERDGGLIVQPTLPGQEFELDTESVARLAATLRMSQQLLLRLVQEQPQLVCSGEQLDAAIEDYHAADGSEALRLPYSAGGQSGLLELDSTEAAELLD